MVAPICNFSALQATAGGLESDANLGYVKRLCWWQGEWGIQKDEEMAKSVDA